MYKNNRSVNAPKGLPIQHTIFSVFAIMKVLVGSVLGRIHEHLVRF